MITGKSGSDTPEISEERIDRINYGKENILAERSRYSLEHCPSHE